MFGEGLIHEVKLWPLLTYVGLLVVVDAIYSLLVFLRKSSFSSIDEQAAQKVVVSRRLRKELGAIDPVGDFVYAKLLEREAEQVRTDLKELNEQRSERVKSMKLLAGRFRDGLHAVITLCFIDRELCRIGFVVFPFGWMLRFPWLANGSIGSFGVTVLYRLAGRALFAARVPIVAKEAA